MFAHVDELIAATRHTSHVMLMTIDLDLDAGRFPDLLVSLFSSPRWDYRKRFYVGPLDKSVPDEMYLVGRLTFEADAGDIAHVLRYTPDGIRWGANLAVGGV